MLFLPASLAGSWPAPLPASWDSGQRSVVLDRHVDDACDLM